uniref:Protein kinase domain-containing protein n=1 Tax=Heterorhabditis bacteriophora TaxID=37862 RepID=A0A1I7WU15_HETBA
MNGHESISIAVSNVPTNCDWPYAYPSAYFLSRCGKVELTSYIMAGNSVRLLAHIMELGVDALSESPAVCEFNQHGFIRECRCTGNSKSPRICIDHHYASSIREVSILPSSSHDSRACSLSTRLFDLTGSGLTPPNILALWE